MNTKFWIAKFQDGNEKNMSHLSVSKSKKKTKLEVSRVVKNGSGQAPLTNNVSMACPRKTVKSNVFCDKLSDLLPVHISDNLDVKEDHVCDLKRQWGCYCRAVMSCLIEIPEADSIAMSGK